MNLRLLLGRFSVWRVLVIKPFSTGTGPVGMLLDAKPFTTGTGAGGFGRQTFLHRQKGPQGYGLVGIVNVPKTLRTSAGLVFLASTASQARRQMGTMPQDVAAS